MSKDKLKERRLKKALSRARLDWDDIVSKAKRGEIQFHDSPNAVALTSIGVSGGFKTCYIIAAAGIMDAVKALEPKVEAFAREQGCQAIECDGRGGWQKVLETERNGFEAVAVKYRKVL